MNEYSADDELERDTRVELRKVRDSIHEFRTALNNLSRDNDIRWIKLELWQGRTSERLDNIEGRQGIIGEQVNALRYPHSPQKRVDSDTVRLSLIVAGGAAAAVVIASYLVSILT